VNRLRRPVYGLCLVLVSTGLLLAHPHFNKTLVVKLPGGAEATLIYNTVPANETHAKNAATGSFITPRQPKLKLSAEVKAGAVTIPAGEYVVGVIKNGDNDWTMALYPGAIQRGTQPDMSKMLKLESEYSTSAGKSAHLLIDIAPGEGKFQGKAALILHFGSMHLSGALS
jgi:hypothetical protein